MAVQESKPTATPATDYGQGFGSFDFVMPPLTKHEGWLKPPKNNLRRKIPAPFPFMQLPPDIRANILKLFTDALVHHSKARHNKIFEANKPLLKDVNKIYPGQTLRIPE